MCRYLNLLQKTIKITQKKDGGVIKDSPPGAQRLAKIKKKVKYKSLIK